MGLTDEECKEWSQGVTIACSVDALGSGKGKEKGKLGVVIENGRDKTPEIDIVERQMDIGEQADEITEGSNPKKRVIKPPRRPRKAPEPIRAHTPDSPTPSPKKIRVSPRGHSGGGHPSTPPDVPSSPVHRLCLSGSGRRRRHLGSPSPPSRRSSLASPQQGLNTPTPTTSPSLSASPGGLLARLRRKRTLSEGPGTSGLDGMEDGMVTPPRQILKEGEVQVPGAPRKKVRKEVIPNEDLGAGRLLWPEAHAGKRKRDRITK